MTFYDDYISPFAVELTVLFVNSYFAKSEQPDQRPAGLVFRKNSGDQFPKTPCFRLFDQFIECHAARSVAAKSARYIHGNFSDSPITIARAIGRSGSKRDNLAALLNHHNGMPVVEPRANIVHGPGARFERRHSILDSLIINRGQKRRVVESGKSRNHLDY
jgi:hypothetical protein